MMSYISRTVIWITIIALITTGTALASTLHVIDVSISPENVKVGDTVTITAVVENKGNTTAKGTVTFKLDGQIIKSTDVVLDPNSKKTIKCVTKVNSPGLHKVNVECINSLNISFIVARPNVSETVQPSVSFRIPPVVKLRPLNDKICPKQDGLIELYMSNPGANDVSLTVEVWVEIPSGIHVKGEGFTVDTAAGIAHALFDIPPGKARTIHVNIRPTSYEEKEITIHTYGYYYPDNNKNKLNPLSMTHPFKILPACPSQTTTTTPPKPIPGFEILIAIIGIVLITTIKRKGR